jgi:hypothetical protein
MHEPIKETPAEYAAQMAAKSGQVPDKFKNEDGSVNIEALSDSYRALENKLHAPAPEVEEGSPVAVDQPTVGTTPQTTMDEMLSAEPEPTTNVWSRVEAESRAGSISESTIAELRAAGVPDSVINNYKSGVKAQAAARTTEAANAVGGVDNLKATMDYARNTFSREQMGALKAQLNGPLWEATLKGLALQAGVTGTQPVAYRNPSTSAPVASPQAEKIVPFSSQTEMTVAIRDPRYRFDSDYQQWVQARIRANAEV